MELLIIMLLLIIALILYWAHLGKNELKQPSELKQQLEESEQVILNLRSELLRLENSSTEIIHVPPSHEIIIEEIRKEIRLLESGSTSEKISSLEYLSHLHDVISESTGAVIRALDDPGEYTFSGSWGVGGTLFYYVRKEAVDVLSKIDPEAAPQKALEVIAELSGKPSMWVIGDDSPSMVNFSASVIEKFRKALNGAEQVPAVPGSTA